MSNLGDNRAFPEPVNRLIEQFRRLPGIGQRSAERMAFHILKSSKDEALLLSKAIADVKQTVKNCSICYNLTDADPCPICADPNRDAGLVMVVEQPKDLISLEQTGMFKGVYHVLLGRIDPLAGVEADDLTVRRLFERIEHAERNSRSVPVREVVLALNPNLEGDSTALYLADELGRRKVTVTRLARGLPTGSQLEYASKAVLADAIEGRRAVGPDQP